MEAFLKQLQQTTLFSHCPEAVLAEQVLPHRLVREYAKGQFAIEPQQQVDWFAVVLSGSVQIMHLFPDGSYSLMSVLREGDLLGADLIGTRSRLSPYHAMAAENTRILQLPASLLTEPGMLEEVHRLQALNQLLLYLSNENMKKEYRLAILSQKGLRQRILTYLTMQAARRRTNTFAIPFSREELAAFLCVNRSALSHELSLMKQEKLITFRKNTFTLLHRTQDTE